MMINNGEVFYEVDQSSLNCVKYDLTCIQCIFVRIV